MSLSKSYYRIMLGRKSLYAQQCLNEKFIGGDWGMAFDLAGKLPDNFRDFNKVFVLT